eukprot:7840154-Alexandrium_andersonii.AAC.1
MGLGRGNCSRLPLPARRPSMSPGSCVMASPQMALSAPPRSGSQPRVGATPVAVLPRGRPRLLPSRKVSLPGLGG